MSATSCDITLADNTSDLLTRVREGALTHSFPTRGTVRCEGPPLFRAQAACDAGRLLAFTPSVVSWTCLPLVMHHSLGMHVSDYSVPSWTGVTLVDAQAPDGAFSPHTWAREAMCAAGCSYEVVAITDRQGFRPDSARDLLRYASYWVSLGSRVRLLALLDEQGPLPLAACVQVIRDGRDAIGTLPAIALYRFVGRDLDEGRIGLETRVSYFHD